MTNTTAIIAATIIAVGVIAGHGISAAAFLGALDGMLEHEEPAAAADPCYSPLEPSVMEPVE
jgi:hypothetical protein